MKSRRDVLEIMSRGAALVAAGAALASCAEDTGAPSDSGGTTDGSGTGTATGTSAVLTGWATGGTAAMADAANYPNPFATGLADETCALTCTLTLGPCYAPTAPVRQDISEGTPGIPVRLWLKVVDADGCTPIEGAEVEIWHCDLYGVYSGDDVLQGDFCTGGDADAEEAYWARGRAITNSDGAVHFDTTYPGWYSGRAVHVHFLVRRAANVGGTDAASAAVVSQLFFPEALTAAIYGAVDGYADQGQPDTDFASDSVIGGVDDISAYLVGYAQLSDGAMLAWKTIAVSDSDRC